MGLAAAPAAAGYLYGTTITTQEIVRLDPATGTSTHVATLSVPSGAMSVAPDCRVLTFTERNNPPADPAAGRLFRYDLAAGVETHTAPGNVPGLSRLAIAPSGAIYGMPRGSVGEDLYRVDPATGVQTLVGTVAGLAGTSGGDLAFDATGQLYAAADRSLYTIDLAALTASLVGTTGFVDPAEVYNGLAFADEGVLYASTGDPTETIFRLYRVDPATGAATYVADVGPVNDLGACVGVTDLELEMTVDDAAPAVGQAVVYTITVRNASGTEQPPTTGIAVTSSLGPGLSFASSSLGAACAASGGSVTCDLGQLAAGETVSYTLSAAVGSPGAHLHVAEISAADQQDVDSTPGNGDPAEDDYAAVTVTAPPPPALIDLELVMAVDDAAPAVGQAVLYTVVVDNAAGADTTATGVTVRVRLPGEIHFDVSFGAACAPAGADLLCTLPALAPGESTSFELRCRVGAEGTWTAIAQVASADQADVDSTPDNDDPSEDDEASATLTASHGSVVDVPTLGAFGLPAFALLLLGAGVAAVRRARA